MNEFDFLVFGCGIGFGMAITGAVLATVFHYQEKRRVTKNG